MPDVKKVIETPVRYDAKRYAIRDEMGNIICTLDTGLIFHHEEEATNRLQVEAEQICEAINSHADLKNQLSAVEAEAKRYREALEHYDDVCAACLSLQDDHDENGQVDLMNEIGQMICGKPYYPAKAALAGKEKSDDE